MQPIPLISAEYAGRLADALERTGVPVDRYLERAHLSPEVRGHPRGFVPGHSVWVLAGEVERRECLGDYWLDCAAGERWRRGSWIRPLRHATTLHQAIQAMCSSYVRHVPMNELGLTFDGSTAWFWRRRVCDVRDWPGNAPAEQYTLSVMLEIVRAAAGPDWLPERVEVECAASGWVATTRRLPGVRIEAGRPLLSLAMPTALLSLPVSIAPLSGAGAECEPPAGSLEGSLRQVLEPWLEGGLPGEEAAAEILSMSPRTLRRRLEEAGTSWRAVTNELKFERAAARLREGRSSVREIAEELGYSNPSHFTRFFRQRAGVSPSAYRSRGREARTHA